MKKKDEKYMLVNKLSTNYIKTFLVFVFITYSFIVDAQIDKAETFSYSKTDAEITEIFTELEKHFGIRFSFATNSLLDDKVDIDIQDLELEEILQFLLDNKSMEYKIVSDNVLIRKTDNYSVEQNEKYEKSFHIKGKVIAEKESQELTSAMIIIENTTIGTYSDENGAFDLEIPEEYINNNLIVSYVGFSPMKYSIKELENEFLIIPLSESFNYVQEISIINKEKQFKIGNYNSEIVLNGSKIGNNTSGVLGTNIFRNIQLLPGITAHNDNSSEIQIRGSTGDATLSILDGIPIYQTSHYYGIFSTVNAAFLDSVNVFRNVFPIKYSGTTGGIVEMLSNNNIPNRTNAIVDINLLTSELALNIPFNRKHSFSFSGKTSLNKISNDNITTEKGESKGRKSVKSFKDNIENNQSSPGVDFVDIHSKYMFIPNKKTSFRANFFLSREQASNNYSTEIFNSDEEELNVMITETKNWQNIGSSLLGDIKLSQRWKYSTQTYFSRFLEDQDNNIDIRERNSQGGDKNNSRITAEQLNSLWELSNSHQLQYQKSKSKFIGGFELNRRNVNYVFKENDDSVIRAKEYINKISLYSSYEHFLRDDLFINMGLKANYFDALNRILLSPRFLLNLELNKNLNLKTSYSNYQQVVRQLYFEYRAVPMDMWVSSLTNDIPVLRSSNYMLGGTFKSPFLKLDVEAYYRFLSGVSEFATTNPELSGNDITIARDYSLFGGNGRIRGIDVILSSGFGNYDTYLSYTLSKAEERFKEINNDEFYDSENDRRHQLKWVNSYYYKRFTFGLNAIYSSGRQYTNITNSGINSDITKSSPDDRFNRLPAYNRFDCSTAYSIKFKKHKIDLSVSVFNIFNTQNVEYIQSVITNVEENGETFSSVVGGESTLLNRTLNIGAKFYFNSN